MAKKTLSALCVFHFLVCLGITPAAAVEINIGQTSLSIPTPRGLVQLQSLPDDEELLGTVSGNSLKLLTLYTPPGELERGDARAPFDFVACVLTIKSVQDYDLSADDFNKIRQRNIANADGSGLSNELKARLEKIDTDIDVERVKLIKNETDYFTLLTLSRVQDASGWFGSLSATATLLVGGKVVILSVVDNNLAQGDVDVTVGALNSWVNDTLAANRGLEFTPSDRNIRRWQQEALGKSTLKIIIGGIFIGTLFLLQYIIHFISNTIRVAQFRSLMTGFLDHVEIEVIISAKGFNRPLFIEAIQKLSSLKHSVDRGNISWNEYHNEKEKWYRENMPQLASHPVEPVVDADEKIEKPAEQSGVQSFDF